MRVSSLLWEALDAALNAAALTEGFYDPTVLPALKAAGYDRTFSDIPSSIQVKQHHLSSSSWREIERDAFARTVHLTYGTAIDVGGIAKGWLAERLGSVLEAIGPCLVDAGGDIVTRGVLPDGQAWPVGLADPFAPDADLALLWLTDQAIATSGRDYRRWMTDAGEQHHIIDPRTQKPAVTDVVAATVIASTCLVAEALAKGALILGAEQGLDWLRRFPNVEAVIVRGDRSVLTTPGLSALMPAHAAPLGPNDERPMHA
jgi:thiamine biosynthesis lipoprotein